MISVIIVSFNTKELTRKCLESIEKYEEEILRMPQATHGLRCSQDDRVELKNLPALSSVEVIVVDNGSDDGSVEVLKRLREKELKGKLKLILNKENLGFSKANNQGIKLALKHKARLRSDGDPELRRGKADYVLLLNSDTELKEEGTIEKLVEVCEAGKSTILNQVQDDDNFDPEVGAVVPRLLNTDGSVQESVFKLPTIWGAVKQYWLGREGEFGSYIPTPPSLPLKRGGIASVESAVMAAMLLPCSTIEKVGYLDEGYHMYFEDLDYCRRIKQAGLKILYVPDVEIVHHHGASGKKLAKNRDQWRRLVPSSIRYHGWVKHWVLHWVLWIGQKALGRSS